MVITKAVRVGLAGVASIAIAVIVGAMTGGGSVSSGAASEADSGRTDSVEKEKKMATATFAAGCFWGVEAAFRQIEGVTETSVGYCGGHTKNPTYREVCSDTTGHAEAVQVVYDPSKVSYEKLLAVFWDSHDPTQVNRQGPDVGSQYRSAIFYSTPEQEGAARASKEELEKGGRFKRPVATSIEPATTFWRAEDYHQQYLEKRGLSTCRIK